MKAGKEYELLIEKMYRVLEPNAEITHDDHIYDERAKTTRQIDVSIKYKFAGVDHLIIVQAKDYKIPAPIKVVDEFQTVISDVKANKGILICSKGFSKAALNKAKSYGIECLTVHSALKKNWETVLSIPVEKITHQFYMDCSFQISFTGRSEISMRDFTTLSYDGVNLINITDVAMDHIIDKMTWKEIKKSNKIKVNIKDISLYQILDKESIRMSGGYIAIRYLKSSRQLFYVEPTDYIYSTDHIKAKGELHNLTLSYDKLESICKNHFSHDKNIIEDPVIKISVFDFTDIGFANTRIRSSVPGGVIGDFIIQNNTIYENNGYNRDVVQMENILKRNTNS